MRACVHACVRACVCVFKIMTVVVSQSKSKLKHGYAYICVNAFQYMHCDDGCGVSLHVFFTDMWDLTSQQTNQIPLLF